MKKTILLSAAFASLLFFLMAFMPSPAKISIAKRSAVKSARAAKANKFPAKGDNSYYIVIDKSDYELKVYDEEGWYATYPIVFGSKDLSDKMKEGDRRTPNGTFKVILKKIHPKWGPELLLDYPGPSDVDKFKERKRKGLVPKAARIGGGYGKMVTPRRKISVIGDAPGADLHPIFVQSLEFVAKFHLFRLGEIQPCIAYFEILFAGRDLDRPGFIKLLSGKINLFNKHGRRRRVGLLRVNHYDAFD